MKLMKTMLTLGVFALMSSIPLLTAQAGKGVKCNDEKQICRGQSGPDVEQTRQRYGDQAAQRLQRRLSKDDNGDRGDGRKDDGRKNNGGRKDDGQKGGGRKDDDQQSGAVFSPIAGVRCVYSERVCYHKGKPDPRMTQQFFEPGAASRMERE
ncbi:MAG: hypothetical protein H6974_10640 [Gammaproteobacteria bacterium]|nr:hypothetical protein [Gammaproteobacteria bacterium]